jgi:DNA-binding response OmpR family regulator
MTAKSKKILIVEDDPFLIKVLGVTLENEGFTVDRAGNGQEALDKIRDNAYGLVMLDLIMPKMNGFEVLKKLKEAKNKTPVLVFSNLSQDADRAEALGLGAKGYFVKSDMPLNEVIKVVKKFL